MSAALILGGCASAPPEGDITITGSTTVRPLIAEIIPEYVVDHPLVRPIIEMAGSGDGLVKLCDGLSDISAASRPINELEIDRCESSGVDTAELRIANDAIVVFTSAQNDGVSCLTLEDLYALTGPESVGFNNWSDAQTFASELGSQTSFPDLPLTVVAPPLNSGTLDAYNSDAIKALATERNQSDSLRSDTVGVLDEAGLVTRARTESTPLGIAAYNRTVGQSSIKLLAINAGGGCVEPTPETIKTGEYALNRSLFIYANTESVRNNAAVESFVESLTSDFFMQEVTSKYALPLSPEDQSSAVAGFRRQISQVTE